MKMVLAKLVVSVTVCILGVWGLRLSDKLSSTKIVLYYGIRLGFMAVYLFALNGSYPSDMPGFFEQARRVLGGEIPNRDFLMPYGFFFNYLLALPLLIWNHPFTIVILFSVMECCGILMIRKALAKLTVDIALVNKSIILYLCSPIVVQCLWLGVQDEALQVTLVGILLLLYALNKSNMVVIFSVIGMAITKIFSSWLVAPFLVTYKNKKWYLFLLITAVFYFTLILFDIKIISSVFERLDGGDVLEKLITAGNIWYFVKLVFGSVPNYFPEILVLVSFCMIMVFCFSGYNGEKFTRENFSNIILPMLILFPFAFNIFYKMTFITYISYAIPFISLFMLKNASRTANVIYLVWAVLYSVNDTFCYRILYHPMSTRLVALTTLYEGLLVVISIYLCVVVVRHFVRQGYSLKSGFVKMRAQLVNFK